MQNLELDNFQQKNSFEQKNSELIVNLNDLKCKICGRKSLQEACKSCSAQQKQYGVKRIVKNVLIGFTGAGGLAALAYGFDINLYSFELIGLGIVVNGFISLF